MKEQVNLIVCKVANGYLVRPDCYRGDRTDESDMYVFNVPGKAAEKDSEGRLTLAGFIAKHFKDPPA